MCKVSNPECGHSILGLFKSDFIHLSEFDGEWIIRATPTTCSHSHHSSSVLFVYAAQTPLNTVPHSQLELVYVRFVTTNIKPQKVQSALPIAHSHIPTFNWPVFSIWSKKSDQKSRNKNKGFRLTIACTILALIWYHKKALNVKTKRTRVVGRIPLKRPARIGLGRTQLGIDARMGGGREGRADNSGHGGGPNQREGVQTTRLRRMDWGRVEGTGVRRLGVSGVRGDWGGGGGGGVKLLRLRTVRNTMKLSP